MAPFITIFIFTILGFLIWGFKGLVIGLLVGKVFTYLIGLLAWPLSRIFNLGPIKKKFRLAIAENFVTENEALIKSIQKYSQTSNSYLIKIFSKYINEIFDASIKIKDPIKVHNYDFDYATHKNNFLRGGLEIWLKQFTDHKESGLMSHFVMYCVNEIYVESYKYEQI